MFDYRYHALSLAAVLLALAVGVLLGVAIGDSDLVSSAKSGIVHSLSSEVSEAQQRAGRLREQLAADETLQNDLYPLAVNGLLGGRSIGLVFLGGSSDEVDRSVQQAVTQAGGDLAMVAAVREPLNLLSLAHEAAGAPGGAHYATLASVPRLVKQFGRRIGIELVDGGALFSRLQARLLSSFDGQLGKLGGLVVMRSDPKGMTPEQTQSTAAFEVGLIDGVSAAGVTAVGVEMSTTDPSQVPWYESRDMASVDDLDALGGRAALAFALAGSHGAYGTKPTANGLLPTVGQAAARP